MEQKPVETCGYVRSRNFLKAWFGLLGDGLGLVKITILNEFECSECY